ncbi:MAG: Rieske 2Fe-2S domain-containing protein [Actinomycetia bacterium]|nr:Rieske 2Fe-2S domain-containing protein [Actinomycetes bacterium]
MATTSETPVEIDSGTGYQRPGPEFDPDLIEVERGTPTGELLRRYWHPFAPAADATDTPKEVRVLGEDLVLYRAGNGEVALMWNRCCHRGTTLYYGKVEERGIRCCYHGWLFDAEGHTLDMPCEPDGGLHKDRYRQPWYPVVDYHGMLFTYMGPPDRKPALPTYDILETVEDGWEIVADDNNIGLQGDPTPCNWFQTHENVMDPFHVFVLHAGFSGNQFVAEMGSLPEVSWHFTDVGVKSHQDRVLADGRFFHRVTEVVMPNVRIVASPFVDYEGQANSVAWTLPISRTETKILTLINRPKGAIQKRALYDGKRWEDLTEQEHQRLPGDYEAQVGQGDVTIHAEERLASSDKGITMFRHAFKQALKAVADGEDPAFVAGDDESARYAVRAGNYIGDQADVIEMG